MDIASRAKAIQFRRGSVCRVDIVIGAMRTDRPDYANEIVAAIDDLTINATSISRILQEDGVDLGEQSIPRHRRKMCRCES